MKTLYVKQRQITRQWLLIDAEGLPLGRVAGCAAYHLRGKHKPYFAPHQNVGDCVLIINASKAKLTGRKYSKKEYRRHSGYPGGLISESYDKLLRRLPTRPMENAIRGMLPKGPLGRDIFRNLRVYPTAVHPHAGQQAIKIDPNTYLGGGYGS